MTQANHIKKNNDFKLVIVFRIEGHDSRAIVLRIAGITAALITVAAKIAAVFIAGAS